MSIDTTLTTNDIGEVMATPANIRRLYPEHGAVLFGIDRETGEEFSVNPSDYFDFADMADDEALGDGVLALRQQPYEVLRYEVGDAKAEIENNMRSRLEDLTLLIGTAEGKGEGWADPDKLEALGIQDIHATDGDTAAEEAQERLDEYPLAVEATTTFEIVIGTGGPDDRFLIECVTVECRCAGDHCGGHRHHGEPDTGYEIRRALYRYSWSGSAERVLTGEDREAVEAFARRVVPELVE